MDENLWTRYAERTFGANDFIESIAHRKYVPVDSMTVEVEAGMGGIYGKAARTLLNRVKQGLER